MNNIVQFFKSERSGVIPGGGSTELLNLRDAWIGLDGKWYPVARWRHEEYGRDTFGLGWSEMKQAGWIKLSEGDWRWDDDGVTQAQFEAIYDWHVANEEEFDATKWTIR